MWSPVVLLHRRGLLEPDQPEHLRRLLPRFAAFSIVLLGESSGGTSGRTLNRSSLSVLFGPGCSASILSDPSSCTLGRWAPGPARHWWRGTQQRGGGSGTQQGAPVGLSPTSPAAALSGSEGRSNDRAWGRTRKSNQGYRVPHSVRQNPEIPLDAPLPPVLACPHPRRPGRSRPGGALPGIARFRWFTLPGMASFQPPIRCYDRRHVTSRCFSSVEHVRAICALGSVSKDILTVDLESGTGSPS
jgi:hypothetical protein